MKYTRRFLYSISLAAAVLQIWICPLNLLAQTNQDIPDFIFVEPKALYKDNKVYIKDSLCLLIKEANEVAQKLSLEPAPISKSDLVSVFIPPQEFAQRCKAVGNIGTSNYVYSVSLGNKLCFIHGTHQDEDIAHWYKTAVLPLSKKNTGEAYRFAADCLKRMSVDVDALNRDYHAYLKYDTVSETQFVPVYYVFWAQGKDADQVASVRFFGPAKKILQIRVEDPTYLLRKALR